MNLSEKIIGCQNAIQDNFVLIEYDLFFANIPDCCMFAIDDCEELEKLNSIIIKIKEMDKMAEIYVCTYIIDFTNRWKPVYADNIWVNTVIDITDMERLFGNCREIEPCYVVLASDDDTMEGIPALIFSSEGAVLDYNTFIEKRELSKIKSLY